MSKGTSPEGVRPTRFLSFAPGSVREIEGEVVDEALVCISVNGEELATFMCTPRDLQAMALGFLYNEGLIDSIDEIADVHLSQGQTCVDVWLHKAPAELPRRQVITAGCGGGVTFDDLSQEHPALVSSLEAAPEQLAELMKEMHFGAELYQRARGIHTAALAEDDRILLQVEDIGRHNCLDKLRGEAMMRGLSTRDRILLSSGRISSEMINKARRMGTPIVCSRTSPTHLSVALAEAWDIALVAYLRQNRMRIYTHARRIFPEEDFAARGNGDTPMTKTVATSNEKTGS